MPTAHPDFGKWYAILNGPAAPPRVAWSGDVFRITEPKWVSEPYRLTGAGALLSGGRWNVQRLMPAIYFADSAETAAAEADADAIRLGWTGNTLVPKTRVAFHLELHDMLDLTDANVLKALKLKKTELMGCDWEAEQTAGREPLSQAVARAAFETRSEGLIVWSARNRGGFNVVVFPPHLQARSAIMPHFPDAIPFVHGL